MCAVTERAQLLLPMTTAAPRAAREFARRTCCTALANELLDDALLLITELVTNSVAHGSPQLMLSIDCGDAGLLVRVRDGALTLPQRRPAHADDEGGRGLNILQQLSHSWGAELVQDEHGKGKAVWFHLPV